MKGWLWTYDVKIVKDVSQATANVSIMPAKQQIMKILLIGIQADNYAAARNIDAYLQLNVTTLGIWEYLFKKDMDSEQLLYPTPDEIAQFGSVDIDRIYLTDEDELVISNSVLDVGKYFRINIRAILSNYALPTIEYERGLSSTGQTETVYQNKIRGVIE